MTPTLRTYELFGLRLATSLPFEGRLAEASGEADFTLETVREPPVREGWHRRRDPVYTTPGRDPDDPIAFQLYRLDEVDVIRCGKGLDFFLTSDRIRAFPFGEGAEASVPVRFLGPVVSLLLERAGLPVLHAAAVSVEGRAVAFLASNHGGKTSLAASFLLGGHGLLTDDLVALDSVAPRDPAKIHVRPGYPEMRMWPEQARYFLAESGHGSVDPLSRVHPQVEKWRVPVGRSPGLGRFDQEPRPLTAIYLPSRQDEAAAVRIEEVGPADAMIELVRHSFLPNLVAAAGWQGRRLDVFSRLLSQCPVRRLTYPSGYEHLPAVRDAILEDHQRGPTRSG